MANSGLVATASYAPVVDTPSTEAVAMKDTGHGPEEEAVMEAEEQEMEDQDAAEGDAEDMRANDPACLLCDDGGGKQSITAIGTAGLENLDFGDRATERTVYLPCPWH